MGLLTITTALALSAFTWGVYNTMQKGGGVAPANNDVFFTSSALVLAKTYSMTVSTFAKDSLGAVSLTKPYAKKFVVQQNSSTRGVLQPGGTLLLAGGVRVSAPDGVLETSIQLSIINPTPAQIPQPVPPGHQVLSKFYKLSSDVDVFATSTTSFEIEIPFESNLDPNNINMFVLTPAKLIRGDVGDAEFVWEPMSTEIDPINKKLKFLLATIEPEGTVFAAIYGTPRSPISVTASQKLVGLGGTTRIDFRLE